MLQTLSRLFRLKPYGDQLVDGMTEVWLFLAALNVAAIAVCDAIAWAYFGYTTAHGAAAYVAAGVAGMIVLTLVGSLDAMFIMHDRARRGRDGAEAAPGTLWERIRSRVRRDHLAVAARIVLVILTFTVTAPFLTQLFFARDIEANIARRNERTVAAARQRIASRFDGRAGDARARLAARQRDLEREIAGSGESRRYGKGPTAAAIEREIGALAAEIASLGRAKATELQSFDAAAAHPEVLARRYGVDLVRGGPETRARVLAELEQSPSFRATRTTIKAFLLFMFLGLVALKLFQPESVRIYYSARLQAAYSRLKAGLFDHRLDPRERPDGEAMTPIRFADWYENEQQGRDLTDRLRDQTALALERLKAQEDAVRALQETLRTDFAKMRDDLAAASKSSGDLEQQLAASRHELDALRAKIAEEEQQLADFDYDGGAGLSLRDQQMLIAGRNRTARNLGEHRADAARLAATVTRLEQRLETCRLLEAQLRAAIGSAGDDAAALARALHTARQKRLADILSAS